VRKLAGVVAAGGLVMVSGLAAAQEAGSLPDLRGTWKGTNEGVVLGGGTHYPGEASPSGHRVVRAEFTMTIAGQEGRAFWGEVSSKDGTERIAGVIGHDGKSLYLADVDGYTIGSLTEAGAIDICYLRSGKDLSVAACNVFTRQP